MAYGDPKFKRAVSGYKITVQIDELTTVTTTDDERYVPTDEKRVFELTQLSDGIVAVIDSALTHLRFQKSIHDVDKGEAKCL
jgi:hypothetical protein